MRHGARAPQQLVEIALLPRGRVRACHTRARLPQYPRQSQYQPRELWKGNVLLALKCRSLALPYLTPHLLQGW